MKILLDMNLSPAWVEFLQREGFEAVHWSSFGDIRAPDVTIMAWARDNACVVFTHDLDFSALLAATQEAGPSVVQIRTQNLLPSSIGRDIVRVLRLRAEDLDRGAIVSIDKLASRVRVLPIRRGGGEGTE